MQTPRRERRLQRNKWPTANHGRAKFALGSPGNSVRVYHAARWRFQRERLSGKAFERCGGRSRIDNLLALEQRSVRICSVQWLNLIPAGDRAMNRLTLYAAVESQVSKTARPGAPGATRPPC